MSKREIEIKGMHCRSCEILIAEKLRELPDVRNVQVSYKTSKAYIHSEAPIDEASIETKIKEAGYSVGSNSAKALFSRNPKDYRDALISLGVFAILYFVAKRLGIFNISTSTTGNPSSLFVVALIGLTAGFSTCMALVGGLILSISSRHAEKHPNASNIKRFRPHLFFNFGRIASYIILGGLIGLAGKAFQLSGTTLGVLIIGVGAVMLILGLQLTELFPALSNGSLSLPSGLSKFLGLSKRNSSEYSHTNSAILGALTFFLPCGFTQAMQLYAMSTGSFVSGALIMGVFAIGTAPGLLGIGGLTSIIKGAFAKRFFRFVGIVVIALAFFNISNGFNLTGWAFTSISADRENATDSNAKIENGFQIVKMDQTSSGYSPNSFTIRKGIPVKWIINSKSPGSCSSSILAPKVGVKKFLQQGENVIEFTPSETGIIKFTCSMGMYSGKFTVVESSSKEPDQNTSISPTVAPEKTKSATITGANDVQLIKAVFESPSKDITPRDFKVIANKPVRFEIEAKADGRGCMGSITIPGLVKNSEFFEQGKTTIFEFTPKKGSYQITCAMGVPRGTITAG